jgi:hypothetical protein
MKKLSFFASVFLTLSFMLSACLPVPQPSVVQQVTKFSQEMKLAYIEAAKVYSAHVSLDAQLTKVTRDYTNVMDNLRAQVRDELGTMELCYTNSQEFFIASITAAFGDNGIGGQEDKALLNLLQLNETYPGDIAACQQMATNVTVYMRSHRAEAVNLKGEIFRIRGEISNLELGDLQTAVILDFYNKYGGDIQSLIQNGDKAFADFVGDRTGRTGGFGGHGARLRRPDVAVGVRTAGKENSAAHIKP